MSGSRYPHEEDKCATSVDTLIEIVRFFDEERRHSA